MFTIYHSNQLDLLKTLTARLISHCQLRDPLQPEVILVQSYGMAQWMQMELAVSFSIAANINFSLPASFIWKMFTCVLPDVPAESMFSKSAMTWRLMTIMQRFYNQPNFDVIGEYLRDDVDKRKQFHFAARVADLFDQYLVFRPDWLERWQHGKLLDNLGEDQRWQAKLWQALIEDISSTNIFLWHRANLYQCFINTLMQSAKRPPGLPDRIFLCGISSLPPTYLQALQALGNHIDIHFMFINPCRYYWGDIRNNTCLTLPLLQGHYQTLTLNDQRDQPTGNPLLASWGKLGRDTLYMLSQLNNVQEVEAFVESSGKECLLSLLQQDILEDYTVYRVHSDMPNYTKSKRLLQLTDRSLSIHLCHSPQREIEVLHDSLLNIMALETYILPREVIVMVADIDLYTPAIQAVFGNAVADRYLPFAISDRQVRHIHPVLPVFLSLLELPRSRFTAEQVLALLEIPTLAARFSISKEHLKLLRQWVAESGIRWGLDDDTQRDLMLPATGQHTWQFGLNRMLLGYAMESKSGAWQGILPYDESSGLIAELVGKLAELLMILRRWRNNLAKPRQLKEWLTCASDIIKDFFIPEVEFEAETALAIVVNNWQQMLQLGIEANYDQLVPITILYDELIIRLKKERTSQRFLAGHINFCTIMPMRSIPFKVVCLLGMNDGVYPHSKLPVGFDLIAQQPRCGDRNRRDEDRYLFLEALLSAQQRLYISFIGRAIQDNTPRYPSVLVRELTDYIAQSFYLPGDEQLDEETSAMHVRTQLWQWHSRMPFAPENFIPGSENHSFAKEWLGAAKVKASCDVEGKPPNFIRLLKGKSEDVLLLDNLHRFYNHPVRAWFQQRLAIWFCKEPQDIAEAEPFTITGINRYQINEILLKTLIEEKDLDVLYQKVRAAGLLTYGAFGKLYWTKQCHKMTILADNIRRFLLPEPRSQEVILTIGNTELTGWLSQVQDNGLLRWRPSYLAMKDGLQLWIEHLAYCAMGGKGESRMFGTNSQWHFLAVSAEEAQKYLQIIVNGYWQGMSEPLFLLNRSGGAWLHYCFNRKTRTINWEENCQREARDKMMQAWQGDKFFPGENSDPYLQRLIREFNEKDIIATIKAAESYFLPLLKRNIADIIKYDSKENQ
ncbi:exodeoxyribonuclease V subunit gamma [Candidatus Palibaumannia cicadellinicola]|uniref:RecBCD enzyme subunit RecC n=1 Tax=Candidatus Palibaumannia cicadellinicola TaxID=186490 RepID=A0A088MYT2_9GAMM|nr:exodeoxyribonuclease V subunit gamma [Candidatus Baumannia cicadellinicola]AIN47467.1 Exodeoxyribonuclease V gamma chain [Candidatus Baumannia cicadellinicola]